MNRFDYVRATSVDDAVAALAGSSDTKVLAGGTNLVDLMKYDVAKPSRVVDINRLPLKAIEETDNGALRIGALVTNSDLAWHPLAGLRVVAGRHSPLTWDRHGCAGVVVAGDRRWLHTDGRHRGWLANLA